MLNNVDCAMGLLGILGMSRRTTHATALFGRFMVLFGFPPSLIDSDELFGYQLNREYRPLQNHFFEELFEQ